MTTKTDTKTTFAKHLLPGHVVYRNGVYRTVAEVHTSPSGVWVYYTDGESAFFLGYASIATV